VKRKFVEYIPECLAKDTLYISLSYATAVHLCCCGCGNEVVTPLAPSGWTLKFNGTVSLSPSIGNWSFPCQSHYWITRDKIVWARRWSSQQIADSRTAEPVANGTKRRSFVTPRHIGELILERLRRAAVVLKQII